jgi:hypothetical protein
VIPHGELNSKLKSQTPQKSFISAGNSSTISPKVSIGTPFKQGTVDQVLRRESFPSHSKQQRPSVTSNTNNTTTSRILQQTPTRLTSQQMSGLKPKAETITTQNNNNGKLSNSTFTSRRSLTPTSLPKRTNLTSGGQLRSNSLERGRNSYGQSDQQHRVNEDMKYFVDRLLTQNYVPFSSPSREIVIHEMPTINKTGINRSQQSAPLKITALSTRTEEALKRHQVTLLSSSMKYMGHLYFRKGWENERSSCKGMHKVYRRIKM